MEFKTVKFIFFWSCVSVQCFVFPRVAKVVDIDPLGSMGLSKAGVRNLRPYGRMRPYSRKCAAVEERC
ncbi:hypothetical protein T11_15058 [Trichinella zimbabwensis]|uniref:Uncharacterized protein n=1 Tax=Trichinella zimbabwensis TaxID=268475 RepID=A0A0V1GEM4_9BILA|nr:hypothetical protein T11_15058 [Trichinella zimbabwensis]